MLYDEVKSFYPAIHSFGVNRMQIKSAGRTDTVWGASLQWDSASEKVNKPEAVNAIQQYLRKRLKADTIWLQESELKKKGKE